MTHDDAKQLLRPLARAGRAAPPVDVSAWVMRDVRALPRGTAGDDAFVWRIAAACASVTAVVVVGVATFALAADENPLMDFASGVVAEAH